MNWLNSIDNILERGLVRGAENDDDTNHSQSTGTDRLHESDTWSDNEGESSHHVPLSFVRSSTVDEEDEEEGQITGDHVEGEVETTKCNPQQSSTSQPLQRTIQQQAKPRPGTALPVRPGNIRLRIKRSVSSSSSEESSDEDGSASEISDASDVNATTVPPKNSSAAKRHKPEPIPISDHQSLLTSVRTSRSSCSMEEKTNSSTSIHLQGSDTSTTGETNLSPLSQTLDEVEPTNSMPEAHHGASTTPELSDAGTINSVISNAQPLDGTLDSVVAQETKDEVNQHEKLDQSDVSPSVPTTPRETELSCPDVQPSFSSQNVDKAEVFTPSIGQADSPVQLSVSIEQADSPLLEPSASPRAANKTDSLIGSIKQAQSQTSASLTDETAHAISSKQVEPSVSPGRPSPSSTPVAPVPIADNDQSNSTPQKLNQCEIPLQPRTSPPSVSTGQSRFPRNGMAGDPVQTKEMLESPPTVPSFPRAPSHLPASASSAAGEHKRDFATLSSSPPIQSSEHLIHEGTAQMPIASSQTVGAKEGGSHSSTESDSSGWSWPDSRGVEGGKGDVSGLGQTSEKEEATFQEPHTIVDDGTSKHEQDVGKQEFGEDSFHDAASNHVRSNNGEEQAGPAADENKSTPSSRITGPHWIEQSDRTLVVANVKPMSPNDPMDGSESSLDDEVGCGDAVDKDRRDTIAKEERDKDETDAIEKEQIEAIADPKLFEIKGVSTTWHEDPASVPLAPMNCYGAFHIRLLRAQRLPCPGGSTVQAKVSLLPWKGRDRTQRRTTFLLDNDNSSFDHGVCAQWDARQDETFTLSLVHAYSSGATPIPNLKLELVLSPVALLEFSMCSLTLPCDILMKRPGGWIRQWFLTEVPDVTTSKDGQVFGEDQIPMVEVEAVFVPDDRSLGASFVAVDRSSHMTNGDEMEIDQSESAPDNDAVPESKSDTMSEEELVPSSKPHLLRYKKFWKPATCGQCSTSLLGWKTKSYRCEACSLDCCEDCRLHVDYQIPCGSKKAIEIVSKAIQNKLTFSKFVEAMAPVDEEYQKKREIISPADAESSLGDTKTEAGTLSRSGEKGRIGVLKLNIARACVFRQALSAASEPDEVILHEGELRPGDYYVRVCRTGSESSARTRTILSSGKLKFEESSEMRLDVAHYGVNFFIEVVDAITDKPVGTSVLTTQGLLQQQRDVLMEDGQMSILTFGSRPPTFKSKRRMTLELRSRVKSGVVSDFFVPADGKPEQGQIRGWVELSVGLEEDVKRLFGPTPYECPAPPPEPLNLRILNSNISRLSDFVEDIIASFSTYQYIVSWRNPLLTGFSFLLFLVFNFKFDLEYVGCLLPLFPMVCMLASAFSRSTAKKRFVEEEAEEWKAAERDIDVNYTLHRPIGRINISVSKGQHIRSREFGLAGNVECRVYLDPIRFANEKQKDKLLSLDKSAKTNHEIGSTESTFTANPVWENVNESEECRRLKQVLPHHGHFFETEEELAKEKGCEFPLLQPFRRVDDEDDHPRHVNAVLEPWKASTAGVVFQIRFRDILSMLPGSDHIFGEVALPLATVVEQGEMSSWFQVFEAGTKDFAKVDEKTSDGVVQDSGVAGVESMSHDIPKIFLTIKWTPPEENLQTDEARESEREASVVIQEELLRWGAVNRDKGNLKEAVVGGSIGAFKTVSGFAGTLQVIQNFLGKVANILEATRNLLCFQDPYKSSLVLAVITLLWIVLSLVPTRLIVLVLGLAQFGLTAKTRLEKVLKDTGDAEDDDDSSVASDLDQEEEGEDAILIWLSNAFRGLPTDEDLRKAYFWEGRRIGVNTRENYATEKRMARLKRLWRAQWHAALKIRADAKSNSKATTDSATTWKAIFAVVQGRRFLWWKTATDFDSGAPPQGRIFLAGHAGLSGLSPLEMREISPKDVPLVVGIFGRGLQDQQRITLLLPNQDLKETLENAVIEASLKED